MKLLTTWMLAGFLLAASGLSISGELTPEQNLGRKLFLDVRISSNGLVACATCHQPDHAFSDGKATSIGAGLVAGSRKSPSLLDVGSAKALFWDGRQTSLLAQVFDPLTNPFEHGFENERQVIDRVRSLPDLAADFQKVYGAGSIDKQKIASAIVAYERTLRSPETAFDRFLAGDQTALDAAQRRGYQLFTGLAACVQCHQINGTTPRLTDDAFHALGVAGVDIQRNIKTVIDRAERARKSGTLGRLIFSDIEVAELGRYLATGNPADLAAFKTPSLRQVGKLAPYMHNGGVARLEEAISREAYYRSTQENKPFFLTPDEIADIAAFLRAL